MRAGKSTPQNILHDHLTPPAITLTLASGPFWRVRRGIPVTDLGGAIAYCCLNEALRYFWSYWLERRSIRPSE
jgi:hypothetical protein